MNSGKYSDEEDQDVEMDDEMENVDEYNDNEDDEDDSDSDDQEYEYEEDDMDLYESSDQIGSMMTGADAAQDQIPSLKIGMYSGRRGLFVHRQQSDTSINMKSASEIIPFMNGKVKEVSKLCNISPSAAQPLLRHYKWKTDRLQESYFDDPEKKQKDAGIFYRCNQRLKKEEGNKFDNNKKRHKSYSCTICFDDELKEEQMLFMPCGHGFCLECWSRQMKAKSEDGPAFILSTCPQQKCTEIVTEEEVNKSAPHLLSTFQRYQLRNFVEMNGNARWCPGPGCDRIAAITANNGGFLDADSTAKCDKCATCFCLKCGNEPHTPLLCSKLEEWKEKCKNESETANWILANTKPCPNCRTRIEKNNGCNHMTCEQCKHHFCWICNGDWKDHNAETGGYYNCNKFHEKDGAEGDQSDAAKAKRELDRYLHYYKRYHAHAEAQKFAMKQLKETETRMMQLQDCKHDATWTDVEFMKTANEQLVECRRVLKFTYVFAYYMFTPVNSLISNASSSDKNAPKAKGRVVFNRKAEKEKTEVPTKLPTEEEKMRLSKKNTFEYHQEMLEKFTEDLSEMVEKSLNEIDRTKIVNQTMAVKVYVQNIIKYVDNDME